MAIMYNTEENLRERVSECLEDDFKHNAIKTAQEVFYTKRGDLVEEMGDGWADLRMHAVEMRNHVTENLDFYVKQFAKNAEANGCIMHYAPTGDDALWEVLDIFEEHGAAYAVKSKSMMTEEVGLNEILEETGIKIVETDCAENILQTAESKPSHIVVPALHFNREAIAEIYREKRGYDGSSVPEEITHFLRKILRQEFMDAEVGIRGCNFGVASTGSVTLVTNEGNGRMVDTFPKVQIVFVGIDRLVPDLDALDTMMALLPRSAVGAKMTAYFSLDSGPRGAGEMDGPDEVHIILMDNGRHELANSEFQDMLRCCRCGACLNICPVYRHITGHGYGSIYPGPMGIVLTAALEGYDKADTLPFACSLCGACSEHCPVGIPLHDLIRQHRMNMVDQHKNHAIEVPVFDALELMWSNVPVYMAAMTVGRPVMQALAQGEDALGENSAWIPIVKGWTSTRDFDVLSPMRFRTWFKEHKQGLAAGADQPEAAQDSTDGEGGDR
ncbi:MAG TPA: iron-sulfur cluster-binding protein [Eggerthellaceae bacterium]|nr:iron-sulfur cluster-binding protein [Eggerthellaceae bacterium]